MAENETTPTPQPPAKKPGRPVLVFALVVIVVAGVTAAVTALLVNIFNKQQEAKNVWVRLVDVGEDTTDPAQWGVNWPREYDGYKRTSEASRTNYGGGDAPAPAEKASRDPWLTRMFAGYAFSLDYRDRRGHAYMLMDQEKTRRVLDRPQPGSCLHCHASIMPTYRRLGGGDVMKGFEALGKLSYKDAHAELDKDGAHPVSCVDCHDPKTMELRVTRPGFITGIKALKKHEYEVAHPGQAAPEYDPNRDATRTEMRSFVCAQCHVEYYCGPKATLLFPWGNGLKVEEIESYYDNYTFPNGERFYDWDHAETKAHLLKAQHPEFELWSQGIHAKRGVACADCHMPYVRAGALKVSDHYIRSPLLTINRSCQPCHPRPEEELKASVLEIQNRNHDLLERSGAALMDMFGTVEAARKSGATDAQLGQVQALHRKAQWRLDFVAAENSMGFHAPQETARILGEAIDYARQGQVAAQKLIGSATRPSTQP